MSETGEVVLHQKNQFVIALEGGWSKLDVSTLSL